MAIQRENNNFCKLIKVSAPVTPTDFTVNSWLGAKINPCSLTLFVFLLKALKHLLSAREKILLNHAFPFVYSHISVILCTIFPCSYFSNSLEKKETHTQASFSLLILYSSSVQGSSLASMKEKWELSSCFHLNAGSCGIFPL